VDNRNASFELYKRIDAAFKSGDFDGLRAAIGNPPGFPNVFAPHDAISCSLLQYAIYHSPTPFIRRLLDAGADPNYDDGDGFPSLIAALTSGRADQWEILEMLLAAGADPNQHGHNDYTPLHFAASEGKSDLVELLLASGADASIKTRVDDYETPAEVAEAAGHAKLAERLRKAER
jgi:uncharacterized protein